MKINRSLIRQTKPARWWLVGTISLSVLQAIFVVAQAYLISRIVTAAFLLGQNLSAFQDEFLWFLTLSILRLGSNTLKRVTSVHASTCVKTEIRGHLIRQFQILGPVALSSERLGELVNTAQEGIENLDAYVSEYLPQIALSALIPLTIIVFILPVDLTSALVLLITAPLIPIFMVLIGDTAEDISRNQWQTLGDLSARLMDALLGLYTLKLFGQSKDQAARLQQLGETHRIATMQVLRVAFLSALVLELVATISTAIVAVQVGLRLVYGRLEFEQAFFVLILAPEFYLPLRSLGAKFHAGISGAVALERVLEFIPNESGKTKQIWTKERREPHRPPRIQFDDVYVRYPGRRTSALRGFNLVLAPGSSTALIGPTGEGKSTVSHLLLRFVEPDEGHILIDGIPLNQLDPDLWWRSVTWVPQHPYLFNASLLDNLRLAAPAAPMEHIYWATQQANIHDFIIRLPNGYETRVGENALKLSAGQTQRIAMARAFLKDSPLIILDEPTANLDRDSELAVMESIRKLTSGRTALLITHRLDTIGDMDQIAVLSSGIVQEHGSHSMLMRQSGPYAELQKLYAGHI
jgi:thiol reductant ABC exporter CydD subunit